MMSRKTLPRATTIVLLLLLAAAPVWANPEDEKSFAALDGNQDGRLSGTELTSVKRFDANDDGRITLEEYLAGRAAERTPEPAVADEALFRERDVNEDGWLSGKEIKGYEAFDADKDGELTKAEFLAGRAASRPKPQVTREQHIAAASKRFTELDITEDGLLSGTETTTVKAYDANRDGRITPAEFTQGYLAQHASGETPSGPPKSIEDVIPAIRSAEAKRLLALMSPELRRMVDEPILQFMLDLPAKELGKMLDRPAEVASKEAQSAAGKLTTYTLTFAHERGKVNYSLALGAEGLILFSLSSDDLKDIGGNFTAEITKNGEFTKKLADFYAPRGEAILNGIFTGIDESIYGYFHEALRKELSLEKAKQQFASTREHNGILKSIKFQSISSELDAQGKLVATRLIYDLDCENGPATGEIRLAFGGYAGGIVGFAVTREVTEGTKPKTEEWQATRVAEHDFEFRMPGKPEPSKADDGAQTYSLELPKEKIFLQVRIRQQKQPIEDKHKEFFDALQTTLTKELKGELLDDDDASLAKHPGKLLFLKMPDGTLHVLRVILVENRTYELHAILQAKPDDFTQQYINRFLESAKIIDPLQDPQNKTGDAGKRVIPEGDYTLMKISGGSLINLGKLEIRKSTYRFSDDNPFAPFTVDAQGNIEWSAGLSFLPDGWKHTASNYAGTDSKGRPLIKIHYRSARGTPDIIDALKE